MLFNVFYKEELFPSVEEIDYIRNETTNEIYHTTEEFINALVKSPDRINHIGHLNVFFPILEKGFQNLDYRVKATKSEYYTTYTPKLKPNTYAVDIIAKVAAEDYRDVKKLRVGSPMGDRYLINFNAFTDYHLINTNYSANEVEFQSYLNSIDCRSTSPAGAMKEDIGLHNIFTTNITRGSGELMWQLKKTSVQPAIISAFAYGYLGKGYCYDINSMYLAQLAAVEYLPDLFMAYPVKERTIIPEFHYGVRKITAQRSTIALPGEFINPGD